MKKSEIYNKLMKEIRELQDKKNKTGLTPEEEQTFCELNSQLTGWPKDFFSKEFNDKLDDMIERGDKLIKKLKRPLG